MHTYFLIIKNFQTEVTNTFYYKFHVNFKNQILNMYYKIHLSRTLFKKQSISP